MKNKTDHQDSLEKINKQLEKGETVIADEQILDIETKEEKPFAAVAGASMATIFRLKSQEYLEKKSNSKE